MGEDEVPHQKGPNWTIIAIIGAVVVVIAAVVIMWACGVFSKNTGTADGKAGTSTSGGKSKSTDKNGESATDGKSGSGSWMPCCASKSKKTDEGAEEGCCSRSWLPWNWSTRYQVALGVCTLGAFWLTMHYDLGGMHTKYSQFFYGAGDTIPGPGSSPEQIEKHCKQQKVVDEDTCVENYKQKEATAEAARAIQNKNSFMAPKLYLEDTFNESIHPHLVSAMELPGV